VHCIHSLVDIDTFNRNDVVIQMARCSFDIHVQEILGTLMSGATLVMLRPKGTIDFHYLSQVLQQKQVTYMNSVPSLFCHFFTYIQQCNNLQGIKCLRSLCSGGR
jgi:non-ribosomal peptide synthetase component F